MTTQDHSLSRLTNAVSTSMADSVRAIQPNDFLRLYEAYFSRVVNYIYYRCADAHTTEDLTAQTFERALDRLGQYRAERAPFGAWLFAIARNLVNDHLQSRYKPACLSLDLMQDQPGNDPTPEERFIENELQSALLQAFEALSERERDILSLKFGARLTNRRIAALTGLSDANIGIIVYRAVHKLRARLDDTGTPYEKA